MTLDCKKVNLKKGSKGNDVKELQKILKEKGFYTGKIDGDFGKLTEDAVKKLQKKQGNTVDGWFGKKTCEKLNAGSTTKTTTAKSKTPVSDVIEKVGGIKITGHRSLLNNFAKVKYKLYYNDVYSQKEALNRILNKLPLNCVDSAQLYYDAYKEQMATKGWTDEIAIVRGTVTCQSGNTFGHVWCRVKENGQWINVDPSAMAAHGYGYGKLICNKFYKITNVNPQWAVSDDGKT
jgi:peptidoglycan hydrolase-like protein with peptidoglycan-binding domain